MFLGTQGSAELSQKTGQGLFFIIEMPGKMSFGICQSGKKKRFENC